MFDSFGFKGPKNVIIQDDKKIINEILYEKLINKELVTLSSTVNSSKLNNNQLKKYWNRHMRFISSVLLREVFHAWP